MQSNPQSTASLAKDIAKRFGVSALMDVGSQSAEPGAYLLLLDIAGSLSLSFSSFTDSILPAGRYVYAGSAYGPGGLKARLSRHLRRDKKRHWHIDHLTERAETITAFAVPGGNECALVRSLLESGQYHQPLPGFGSSDCQTCMSHLLAPI